MIYFPRGNGKVEFTNKVIGTLLTKLVIEKQSDWDEHLPIVLFLYQIAYKVANKIYPTLVNIWHVSIVTY
jgi:hypothetical protein